MDRVYDKEKSSSRKSSKDDRDSSTKSDRDRDNHRHHHRSSRDSSAAAGGGARLRESEERHHSDRYREEKHRSSRNYEESKRDRSHEPRSDREGSIRDDRLYREESVEGRSSHKRKEHIKTEDRSKKRSKHSKEEKRERRRFEDIDGDDVKEERREKRRFEDRDGEDDKEDRREKRRVDETRDLNGGVVVREEVGYEERVRDENGGSGRHGKRERRRFGDKAKEEGNVKLEEEQFGDERLDKGNSNGSSYQIDGAALEPPNMTSSAVSKLSSDPSRPPPTKVSSISTTNENKGVSVTRSHEVPGKSSTDGTNASAASKGGRMSLDAIAKAKKALQMQKEISEKLKKIPLFNKASTSSSDGLPQVGLNKAQPGSVPLTTTAAHPHGSSSVSTLPAVAPKPSVSGIPTFPGLTTVSNIEAVKRAQELAAKMGFHHDPEFAPVINMFPGHLQTDVTVQHKPTKAPVLRVDALGREIDEHGNVINVAKLANLSTLKVNINKQKKEAFQILKPELEVDPESNPHFDPEMGINKAKLLRPKRMSFQFVEEGRWSKEAEIIKLNSQFGEAKAKDMKMKQAQLAKAKTEPDINPNLIEVSERVIIKEKPKDPIPDVEWWDVALLLSGNYGEVSEESITEDKLKMDRITIYVEHPLPIEPPAEPVPPPPQPLKLTKKEQKKLRTQRRLAKEKDKQEMIRQGVIEPPKPKVKMSNLMRVLGAEATQDPTRLELEIRSAAAEREQAHVDRNIARKLTPAERREKKERKLFEDPNTLETIVSIYKINDLSHPQTRFKVDVNAQENRLYGCAVISDDMCVVVVEGGSKPIKRYGKLMLRRINWADAVPEEDDDENEDKPVNKCLLVWQGSVARPSFNRFLVHQCRTEAAARKVFSDAGVGHYWDLAANFQDEDI